MGTKATMGQHTMEAHRHTQRNTRIRRYQQYQIGPMNGSLPEQSYSENGSEQGDDNHYEDDNFVYHVKSQENLHLYVLHCTSGTLVGVIWGRFCLMSACSSNFSLNSCFVSAMFIACTYRNSINDGGA